MLQKDNSQCNFYSTVGVFQSDFRIKFSQNLDTLIHCDGNKSTEFSADIVTHLFTAEFQ